MVRAWGVHSTHSSSNPSMRKTKDILQIMSSSAGLPKYSNIPERGAVDGIPVYPGSIPRGINLRAWGVPSLWVGPVIDWPAPSPVKDCGWTYAGPGQWRISELPLDARYRRRDVRAYVRCVRGSCSLTRCCYAFQKKKNILQFYLLNGFKGYQIHLN